MISQSQVPAEFLCPITTELMEDPVICADGRSYERSAITRWLETSQRSPMTGAALESTVMLPNVNLKALIEDWSDAHIVQAAMSRSGAVSVTEPVGRGRISDEVWISPPYPPGTSEHGHLVVSRSEMTQSNGHSGWPVYGESAAPCDGRWTWTLKAETFKAIWVGVFPASMPLKYDKKIFQLGSEVHAAIFLHESTGKGREAGYNVSMRQEGPNLFSDPLVINITIDFSGGEGALSYIVRDGTGEYRLGTLATLPFVREGYRPVVASNLGSCKLSLESLQDRS